MSHNEKFEYSNVTKRNEARVNLSLIRAKFPLSPTVDSHYKRTESLYITREPAFP